MELIQKLLNKIQKFSTKYVDKVAHFSLCYVIISNFFVFYENNFKNNLIAFFISNALAYVKEKYMGNRFDWYDYSFTIAGGVYAIIIMNNH